ncbi:MAG: phosphoglucosamine mutase [Deltaproteobacteria bacterium]|nr:MAG: phosphoglucosamine mutase [Deltaproteobacteria bacterium]
MIQFGTDGIRGEAGRPPLTAEVALQIGRAAVKLAREGGGERVMIARDTRPSGLMLAYGVAAGVAAEGGEAVLIDVLPTSALMANLAAGAAEVGVMVTASHNPAPDNGFKLMYRGGRKLSEGAAERFERWLTESPGPSVPGQIRSDALGARQAYQRALDEVAPPSATLQGVRIGVDLSFGAAQGTARWLKERYPGVEWVLRGRGEGVINEGVGSEHPAGLAEVVRAEGCDFGFAVDGDADRCVLIDDLGAVVPGDVLTWWLASRLQVRSLATTVMSTNALEAALTEVRIERTPVGDRHLMHAMRQQGIPLGCEESGHVIFLDGLPGGDGILTGLKALSLAEPDVPLSSQLRAFTPFPRKIGVVRTRVRPPLETLDALQRSIERAPRRLGPGGRVLVRYSGTEPVLRLLVEGPDASAVQQIFDELTEQARESLQ